VNKTGVCGESEERKRGYSGDALPPGLNCNEEGGGVGHPSIRSEKKTIKKNGRRSYIWLRVGREGGVEKGCPIGVEQSHGKVEKETFIPKNHGNKEVGAKLEVVKTCLVGEQGGNEGKQGGRKICSIFRERGAG